MKVTFASGIVALTCRSVGFAAPAPIVFLPGIKGSLLDDACGERGWRIGAHPAGLRTSERALPLLGTNGVPGTDRWRAVGVLEDVAQGRPPPRRKNDRRSLLRSARDVRPAFPAVSRRPAMRLASDGDHARDVFGNGSARARRRRAHRRRPQHGRHAHARGAASAPRSVRRTGAVCPRPSAVGRLGRVFRGDAGTGASVSRRDAAGPGGDGVGARRALGTASNAGGRSPCRRSRTRGGISPRSRRSAATDAFSRRTGCRRRGWAPTACLRPIESTTRSWMIPPCSKRSSVCLGGTAPLGLRAPRCVASSGPRQGFERRRQ